MTSTPYSFLALSCEHQNETTFEHEYYQGGVHYGKNDGKYHKKETKSWDNFIDGSRYHLRAGERQHIRIQHMEAFVGDGKADLHPDRDSGIFYRKHFPEGKDKACIQRPVLSRNGRHGIFHLRDLRIPDFLRKR